MRIKEYNSFEDQELIAAWQHLQDKFTPFPMMRLEWILPWWESNTAGRELCVVVVYNNNDTPLGLAPFCIQKEIGVRVLRSIPIHFGDFYEFISSSPNVDHIIINHIKKGSKWDAIHIFNCFDKSAIFEPLTKNGFNSRKVVKILAPNFKDLAFTEYLKTISKNSRSQFKKKMRRLEKNGDVKLQVIKDWEGYSSNFHHTKRLYNMRWKGDDRPLLSDEYYSMRNKSLKGLFQENKAVLYLIEHDKTVIAFRLGFLEGSSFFDWKTAHNPEYDYYSPGFLSVGLIIQDLIKDGYEEFNFMTGNYQYKRSWNNQDNDNFNQELLYSGNNLKGKLFVAYRLKWREKIKKLAETLNLK